MPNLSQLKLAVPILGAAGLALDAISPDQAEGISASKSAVDFAMKNWRKLNPGKVASGTEVSKWAMEDVPKALGLNSKAVHDTDRALLSTALQHPDLPYLPANTINALRAETAAIPDPIHEVLKPRFSFDPMATPSNQRGTFYFDPKTSQVNRIAFNPNSNSLGKGTAGHELGSHGIQYDKRAESLFDPKDLENIRLTRSIDTQHDLALKGLPDYSRNRNDYTPADLELARKAATLYLNKPSESTARAMGKEVSNAVSSGGENLKSIKDINTYLQQFNNFTKQSIEAAFQRHPEQYSAAIPKLAIPAAIGASALLPYSSEAQDKSNVDKTQEGRNARPLDKEQTKIPANVMLGDPSEGLISENVMRFFGENPVVDFVKAGWNSLKDLSSAMTPEGAKKYMETKSPTDVMGDLLNIGGGSVMADAALGGSVKGGLGVIGMPGFFSSLTKALKESKIGKIILSPKMTGEQMLKTLQSAGIKEDELVFSGVGDALSAIGKDRIGPTKMAEIAKIAEEGALGFTKKESPGIHSQYSLFQEGDPSFKNVTYSYPGVKFEEGHFGEGVVAHRRVGDKVIATAENQASLQHYSDGKLTDADMQSAGLKNSLMLDEVQSQFYEKGSKFGHGEPKVPFSVDDAREWEKGNFKGLSTPAQEDYKRITELLKERNIDTSSPQGFAKSLVNSSEEQKILAKYDKNFELYNSSVENAPLRGEKYVELLAKDHLRDALSQGKDAISWTPSEVQHERYYGKGALGSVEWKFDPHIKGATGIRIDLPGLAEERWYSNILDLDKDIGQNARKKLLEDMQNGITSGTLEGNAKEVYQKLYDRAIPKAFEKLTGEKPREGFVKGRNGEDVKIQWIPLDKVKEKMVVNPAKEGNFKELEKSLISHPQEEFDIRGPRTLKDTEEYILQSKKNMEEGNLTKSKAYKKVEEDLIKIKEFKDKFLPKVKDLPIAHSQEVLDFFKAGKREQASGVLQRPSAPPPQSQNMFQEVGWA